MQIARFERDQPVDTTDQVARHSLDESLRTTAVAINHYRIAPGDGFPSGLHAHADQEELFYVLDGAVTFEVITAEGSWDSDETVLSCANPTARDIVVKAGELIRFAPGEFQTGWNAGDEQLVALALGAPRDSDDVRFPQPCPACDHPDLRLDTEGSGISFRCPSCDDEFTPRGCHACENSGMRFRLVGGADDEAEANGYGSDVTATNDSDDDTATSNLVHVTCPECSATAPDGLES
jgi:uncharacterized cupin superfamily protein